MIDAAVFDFIERCQQHKEAKPLLGDLLSTVKEFGFDHLIVSGVPVGGQKLAPMVELNGWPSGWFERYVEQSHAAIDGVCLYSASTLRPFYWADVPAPLSDTKGNRQVQSEAASFGIRSGFAVPMLSVQHWQSVVSFASPANRCDLSEREKSQLIMLATYSGMAVQEMLDALDAPPPLSPREREVLLWAAGGKTIWETSEILSLSEKTIEHHLSSVRQKFGVARTVQAIVEAIRRRIIHP